MALNFPTNPSNGDTFLGSNGINYIWVDSDSSWQVYNDPAAGIQVWDRDTAEGKLFPVYNGDSLVVTNTSGSPVVTLSSDGEVIADKFTGFIDIESYPTLP